MFIPCKDSMYYTLPCLEYNHRGGEHPADSGDTCRCLYRVKTACALRCLVYSHGGGEHPADSGDTCRCLYRVKTACTMPFFVLCTATEVVSTQQTVVATCRCCGRSYRYDCFEADGAPLFASSCACVTDRGEKECIVCFSQVETISVASSTLVG